MMASSTTLWLTKGIVFLIIFFFFHNYFGFKLANFCPISVALLEWCSYLVKVVEVWWCPFHHSKKESYVPVSQSFWHVNPKNTAKMHSEDRDNPMFVDIHKKNLDL